MLVILLLTFFMLCPHEGAAAKPSLKLTALGPKLVKGTYQYNESLGIQFDIRPSSMKMKNLKGEILASYMKLARDAHYFQIADQGFVSVEKKPVRAVPNDLPKTMEALKDFANQQSSDEGENVRKAHEAALEKLRKFDETRLFEAASKAIAAEGGSGRELELTQPYHLLSLNLLKALDKTGKPVHSLIDRASEANNNEGPHRAKRCASLKSDPNGDNCFGMCGRKCDCWWWVCFNCCRNEGCAQHDECCNKDWNSSYCQEPWRYRFRCGSYGAYNKC